MTQEEKQILLKDLCARLPYGVRYKHVTWDDEYGETYIVAQIYSINTDGYVKNTYDGETDYIDNVRPYLFPLSSMTEEEAKELSVLYGIKDILSINITDEYIDFKVDDGFCSFERKTIWYNEIISSTETFDWLNENHFDYRGLIEKGLAIDATGLNIY